MDVNNTADVTALGGLMFEMMSFEQTHSKQELSDLIGKKYFYKQNNQWYIGLEEIKKLDLKGLTELTEKISLLLPTLN